MTYRITMLSIRKRIVIALFAGWLLAMTQEAFAVESTASNEQSQLRFHVVFNNVPYKTGLQTAWGFACLIEGLQKTVLFDTGNNGEILLSNMRQLGLDSRAVDMVVLSHIHKDHVGGLDALLRSNHHVDVIMPASSSVELQRDITHHGASVITISAPQLLFTGVHTTGEMGHEVKEQALIVDTSRGLVVITGCAHPNVADMAERASTYLGKKITLLMGGFHLEGNSDSEIRTIIARLKVLGVQHVAPSHCTGEAAMHMFRKARGQNYIEGGLGTVITVPK
jgi:7,8-dihydropterin-6-yl-methyl-4-(beta-D-ribofuranosyl)aminobenzene 5'-phosphate synthase